MSTDIRILRSASPSLRPLVSDLESGQPMANIESSDPGLYFRLDNDQLMKVGPSHVGPTAPNSASGTGGSSGNSVGETWVDTSNSNLPLLKIYTSGGWLTVSTKGEVGQKGEKGTKGDKFIYDDFTPSELLDLKGEKGQKGTKGEKGEKGQKGTKGDKFIFSDFTQPELDSIKGEKGFKGTEGAGGGTGGKGDKGEVGPTGPKGDEGQVPSISLGQLSDVNVLLPSNRDRLVYNSLGSTWVAEAQFPNPDTGWGTFIGTSTKSGFNTGSVTTEQLAERVKALIEALDDAGLIDS